MSPKPQAKPRRRLDAEAARQLILDVTEKRLVKVGPAGIRLQEVAADAGVSHSTVLHHFGSRELLVKAVTARALRAMDANLIEAMHGSTGDADQLEAMLENLAEALQRTGYARVMMWLALEGHHFDAQDVPLDAVVEAAHAMRLARKKHTTRPSRDDTARIVVLVTIAISCGSVLTPSLLDNAGLASDAVGQARFRSWLTRLIIAHIDK